MLAHLAALYWPRTPQVHAPRLTDKLVHLALFAVPVLVGAAAGLPLRWVAVLLAIHAPVSELIQHVVLPNRSGDVWDLAVDLLGVVLAVALLRGWRRLARVPSRSG